MERFLECYLALESKRRRDKEEARVYPSGSVTDNHCADAAACGLKRVSLSDKGWLSTSSKRPCSNSETRNAPFLCGELQEESAFGPCMPEMPSKLRVETADHGESVLDSLVSRNEQCGREGSAKLSASHNDDTLSLAATWPSCLGDFQPLPFPPMFSDFNFSSHLKSTDPTQGATTQPRPAPFVHAAICGPH